LIAFGDSTVYWMSSDASFSRAVLRDFFATGPSCRVMTQGHRRLANRVEQLWGSSRSCYPILSTAGFATTHTANRKRLPVFILTPVHGLYDLTASAGLMTDYCPFPLISRLIFGIGAGRDLHGHHTGPARLLRRCRLDHAMGWGSAAPYLTWASSADSSPTGPMPTARLANYPSPAGFRASSRSTGPLRKNPGHNRQPRFRPGHAWRAVDDHAALYGPG
jgi:hypothetical protein